jgi:signal transduction histidine kinase/ActR/RegA family two-component response regulator
MAVASSSVWFLPVRRLRGWGNRSVLNRLTAISLGTSILLLLLVALIAFPLFYFQERSNNASRDRSHLERANESVRFRITALMASLDQLAGNSFVVNAFVDSTGREIYLFPTLRDYRAPLGIKNTLVLLDSNLTVFGRTGADRPLAPIEAQSAMAALEKGKTQLKFDAVPGRPRLLIAVPVFYPPASAYEGVLLSTVDVGELMQPVMSGLTSTECLTISLGARELWSTPCKATELATRQSLQSSIAGPAEGDIAITVTFGEGAGSPFRLLTVIAAVYVVLSSLALLLVFAATRYVGRAFTGKLEELAQTANALAADPNLTLDVRWDHPDEIGRLMVAFDTLVDKWREIQSSLEHRVQRRTEELAGALEQAQASSRAKSDFLAVMSHEIRTPMNGVVGMIQVLESTELSPVQRRQLEVIRSSSDLLLRVIDDLLDFSKIEAGKFELDSAPLRVDLLMRDTIAALSPAAAGRGVELQVQPLAPELAQSVTGDATRLRQVLTNLIHNAIKFTAPGGSVRISATVQPRQEMRQFVFEIRDTGIGIDASKLRRIFEPFEQADRSTTRRFGGTGLGLAIVKRLIDMMGGRIDVESEPGKGSRFKVELMLPTAGPPPGAGVQTDRSADFAKLRVLVAEDNPTNQLVATAQLNALGIDQVSIAANGREAVDTALRGPFDLILMDIHMPDMDGFEATNTLRCSGVTTPIVAMTANVLPEDRAAYIEAGMVDCLAKPMDIERMRKLIQRCCPADVLAPAD